MIIKHSKHVLKFARSQTKLLLIVDISILYSITLEIHQTICTSNRNCILCSKYLNIHPEALNPLWKLEVNCWTQRCEHKSINIKWMFCLISEITFNVYTYHIWGNWAANIYSYKLIWVVLFKLIAKFLFEGGFYHKTTIRLVYNSEYRSYILLCCIHRLFIWCCDILWIYRSKRACVAL